MTIDELRYEIKADAQACEELTVGDEPLSPDVIDDVSNRVARLQRNLGRYRSALRRLHALQSRVAGSAVSERADP